MTEVSRNLRNIFLAKIPTILKVEVGIFSDKKSFSQNQKTLKSKKIGIFNRKKLGTLYNSHKGIFFYFYDIRTKNEEFLLIEKNHEFFSIEKKSFFRLKNYL